MMGVRGRSNRATHRGLMVGAIAACLALAQLQAGEEKTLSPAMGTASLAYDASAGTVLDREGIGLVQAQGSERWTLLGERTPVTPGDWVKTGARGANAVEIALKDGTRLTLGPAGLLENTETGGFRLHAGELAIVPAKGAAVTVEGPGNVAKKVEAVSFLGIREKTLAALPAEPRWHALYRSRQSTEALGELVANIDGRDVPLTLGYHKVTVDIRDQIARTAVEESFVNHTDATLEGQFYFPLPQEASIAGFAMWIGNELVEADIVEKERARAIFEEIVREKRDPALLEWTGGTIFKARVFPIPAQGEKRIRITYTQVLPKQGRAYRYAYALKSELLTKTPLRELALRVTIDSAEELAQVICTSHLVRTQKTAHAATLEFTAQEYTPDRDFEVLVTTAPATAPLLVIPHQRGKDGYFMALLQADEEAAAGAQARATPLDVIILVDTSNSLRDEQLKTQRAFVACLLEALGPKDTFNIVAFDVAAAWAFSTRTAVSAETRDAALAFLERRGGLGWTDLDLAFKEALAQAHEDTQVIYVGDGIPTSGDADPAAFAARLKVLYKGAGALHAVGIGSTYEAMVLKAIASLGRGSFRQASDAAAATAAAAELLAEITAPGLKDVAVSWQGFRTACVYPAELPNLPAGGQQIILGRYLPEGKDLAGKAVLTATAGGKKITRELAVAFKGAEEGNAFIPRLWARMHLDELLAQGRSAEVKEAIALSENYQIITPYTSLLVLESDADRERFKVTKRLRMRDAEEFFAEGKERTDFALAREHMRKTALWRKELRNAVLNRYGTLGTALVAPAEGPRPFAYTTCADLPASTRGDDDDSECAYERSSPDPALQEDLWGDPGASQESDEEETVPIYAQVRGEDSGEPAAEESETASEPRSNANGRPAFAYSLAGRNAPEGVVYAEEETKTAPPFGTLFPAVPDAPASTSSPKWPAEVRALLAKVDRRAILAARRTGLAIEVEEDSIDARGAASPGARRAFLCCGDTWVARTQEAPGEIVRLQWCCGGERGAGDVSRLFAAARKAKAGDEVAYVPPFERYFDDLEKEFADHRPALATENGKAVLTLTPPGNPRAAVRMTVDPENSAILAIAFLERGKETQSETFADFVDIDGLLWPRKIEYRDAEGGLASVVRIAYRTQTSAAFAEAVAKERAALAQALTLTLPLPTLIAAKTRVREQAAAFADRWRLMLDAALTQAWNKVAAQFEALEALAAGKPALDWVRVEMLRRTGRGEEAKQAIMKLAAALDEQSRDAGAAARDCAGRARLLLEAAAEVLHPLEKLALLEILKPVYTRGGMRAPVLGAWADARIECLRSLGRDGEALSLRWELAKLFPYDLDVQVAYAHALVERDGAQKAVAHLEAHVRETPGFSAREAATLAARAASLLYGACEYAAYTAYVDAQLVGKSASLSARVFDRYLSALIFADHTREADALMAAWLAGGRGEDPDPIELARLQAALLHALGRGDGMWRRYPDPKWVPAILDVGRACARSETQWPLASDVFGDFRLRLLGIRAYYDTLNELYDGMVRDLETLPPAVLENLWSWTSDVSAEGRMAPAEFARALLARWQRETDAETRRGLAAVIVSVGEEEQTLALRRLELATAPDAETRAAAAQELLHLLLGRPWSAEAEREAAGLIAAVGFGRDAPAARIDAVESYARYVVDSRVRALLLAIPGRLEKSRRELRPLEREANAVARREGIVKLEALAAAGLGPELAPFITIERATLEVKTGVEPTRVFAETAALLEALPDLDDEAPLAKPTRVLAERCACLLGYLATARGADPALAERYEALLDAAIAKKSTRIDARLERQRLLVALDRGEALEAALRAWAADEGAVAGNRWRVALAYVLAERGKLQEAVETLGAAQAIDELGAPEYLALVSWSTALGESARSREARRAAYEALDEDMLAEALGDELWRYRRTGRHVPEELREETVLMLAVLLEKTEKPSARLQLIQEYYEATKDFRLLATIGAAVVGRTAAQAYVALQSLRSIVACINDEATIDRVLREVRARRAAAANDVDRRVLAMFEFMLEAKAAAQGQGGEPHGQRASAALGMAFEGTWAAGEEALMARFLASLEKFPDPLETQVLARLAALHDAARAGTSDRFELGVARVTALWENGVKEDAANVLAAAIEEYRAACGGALPRTEREHVVELSSYLEESGRVLAAEKLLRAEIARSADTRMFRARLYSLYLRVLGKKGTTALGEGEALYRAVRDEILAALDDPRRAYSPAGSVELLCEVYVKAHAAGIASAEADLRAFAFQTFPPVLARGCTGREGRIVQTVAARVRKILGPRAALEFLLARLENEPRGASTYTVDFWDEVGGTLLLLRKDAGELGDLEPRLLALVRARLARALEYGGIWVPACCEKERNGFWEEKAAEFEATALAVLERQGAWELGIVRIARYLRRGLGSFDTAIGILDAAWRKGVLGREGAEFFVETLQERRKSAESLAVLEGPRGCIARWPDALVFREALVDAYHGLGLKDKTAAACAELEAQLHARGDTREYVSARVAWLCVRAELFEQALAHFKDAIAMSRSAGAPGREGSSELSGYYRGQAQALAALGRTSEAIDAAAGAVVVAGSRSRERAEVLGELKKTLAGIPDLGAYAAAFEKECAASRLEKPLVRKVLGEVLLEKEDYAAAERHLEAYLACGGFDAGVLRALVRASDAQGATAKGTARLRELARLSGRDYTSYQELAERLQRQGDKEEAERALTTLAELSPNEPEGHALLAGLREKEERFAEAAAQWRCVLLLCSREPEGYLGLGRSLMAAGRRDEARAVLEDLLKGKGPSYTANAWNEAHDLLKQLGK